MKKVKVEVQDYEIMHLKTVKKIIPGKYIFTLFIFS